ncbi:MAG: LuxR C-terminal-related transcriptional regulator [Gemmatimonadota bacterium]
MEEEAEKPGSHKAKDVISVALFKDNRLIREGLVSLLTQYSDLKVTSDGSNGGTLLMKEDPHVVLLDFGFRRGDSLRLAEKVRKERPEAKVIVMDLLPVQEDLVGFVHAGVSGFIMKDATLDELVNAIRAVAKGAHILPPEVTGALFSQIAGDAVSSKGRSRVFESVRMTPREREVINCIAEGMSNKEIARTLHIATHTVKSHVRNIMEKLTVNTRLQIAAHAHREAEDS